MPSCFAFGCTNRPDVDRKRGITFHRKVVEFLMSFVADLSLKSRLTHLAFAHRNAEIYHDWVQAVNRANKAPGPKAVLCSTHFREEDVDRTILCVVRVRDNAVPSIFPEYPPSLQPKPVKHRKALSRRGDPPPQRKRHRVPVGSSIQSIENPENPSIQPSEDDCQNSPPQSAALSPPVNPAMEDHPSLSVEMDVTVSASEQLSPVIEEAATSDSPRKQKLKMENAEFQSVIASQRKKIKTLQQKNRQLNKKAADLKAVLKHLTSKELISSKSSSV
ncbi:hypothetical protein CAPTEDRAFT_191479 [Capitella teleta]|uniref:THAP-type domain-containing protein n=1 Tax=Capitella teleta TaxID=283909 RepID=R7U2R4_CAPTE|nr:hypothetical protein CAPTEDRAFT_191479 [Capitella teleta]|eukprot:ELU00168.1 hypothetical protein CAPTEDRAFT_191479 [Capitella teleta]